MNPGGLEQRVLKPLPDYVKESTSRRGSCQILNELSVTVTDIQWSSCRQQPFEMSSAHYLATICFYIYRLGQALVHKSIQIINFKSRETLSKQFNTNRNIVFNYITFLFSSIFILTNSNKVYYDSKCIVYVFTAIIFTAT